MWLENSVSCARAVAADAAASRNRRIVVDAVLIDVAVLKLARRLARATVSEMLAKEPQTQGQSLQADKSATRGRPSCLARQLRW